MRNKLISAAALLFVGVTLGGTVFRVPIASAANLTNVFITNLDANGNVKVHEQGTAAVQLAPRNIYENGNFCNISTTDQNCHTQVGPGVPVGQELVLENASAEIQVPAGTSVLAVTIDVTPAAVDLIPVKIGSDGGLDYYTAAQLTRGYLIDQQLNAPQPVTCSVFTGVIGPGGVFHCNLVGYLVTPG